MRTLAVLIAALALTSGCKSKPNQADPATGSAGSAPAGSAPAGSAADATKPPAGSGSAPVQNVLELPKPAGKPFAKSAGKIGKDQIERMTTIDVPTWHKEIRNRVEHGVEVRYRTNARPKITVTLTSTECFGCTPPDVEAWKAKGDALKGLLAPELRDRPDTEFEVGGTEANGTPVIYTYQVGYVKGDPEGGMNVAAFAYSDAYALYYNDGVNMIRVVAEYKDDPPASREDMLRLVPREDLEKIGKAFLELFVHTWTP